MTPIQTQSETYLPAGTIFDARTHTPITEQALMDDLSSVSVVYAGEQHTQPEHHQIQLTILKSLWDRNPNIVVGMEMFDRTYQPVLDRWSNGELTLEMFLKLTHWGANWKFPIALYQDILEFIRDHHLRLAALNIPFNLPPKIAIGGIDSLTDAEKRLLPRHIDTGNQEHLEYLKKIFDMHPIPLQDNFDFFYEAQCTWEDAMAEAVSENVKEGSIMVVILGNGHIYRYFGVPDRAYSRTEAPFRTVYPMPEKHPIPTDRVADYLWITPSTAGESP
jgi:uncharacterized iron-regulated protein